MAEGSERPGPGPTHQSDQTPAGPSPTLEPVNPLGPAPGKGAGPEWLGYWSRRVKNSAIFVAMLGTAWRAGANLFLFPLVLTYLSQGEQAVWYVFLALGGIGNLADFGFGQVIQRVYSFLWAGAEDFESVGIRKTVGVREPNLRRIRELNATVRYLYLRLSLGACAALAIGGTLYLMTQKPMASLSKPVETWALWAAYIVVIGYNLVTTHWLFAASGTNRVRDIHLATLWSNIAYFVVVSAMLFARLGLIAMVVGTALRAFLMRQLTRRAYFKAVPEDATQRAEPDKAMVKRLWPNSWKFGVQALGGYFLVNGSVLICFHSLGKEITASFGATNQVGGFVRDLAALWLAVKWPELTMLRTQGRLPEMSVLFARRLALVMITFAALALFVIAFGNPLLALKGTTTRLLDRPHLLLYFVYSVLGSFYVQWAMLVMTDNTVPFFKLGLATGVGMMALSLVLTPIWGLWGLLLAPLIAEAAGSAWYCTRAGLACQPLSVRELIRAAAFGRV